VSWLEFGIWNNYRFGITLAVECFMQYEKALTLGLTDLKQDMERAEPYDHDKPKGDYEKIMKRKTSILIGQTTMVCPSWKRALQAYQKCTIGEC